MKGEGDKETLLFLQWKHGKKQKIIRKQGNTREQGNMVKFGKKEREQSENFGGNTGTHNPSGAFVCN